MSYNQAAKLYKDFRGFDPREVIEYDMPDQTVYGMDMGRVAGIAYDTVRDGEPESYYHEFEKNSAPRLVASADGRQLFLPDGDYRVTDEGITDMAVPLIVANPHKRGSKKKGVSIMAKKTARKVTKKAPAKGVVVYASNPAPRQRRRAVQAAKTKIVYRKRNPVKRFSKGGLDLAGLIAPALTQAGGAVAVSFGTAVIATALKNNAMKTGPFAAGIKIGLGLVGGYGLSMVNKKIGRDFAAGALVIAITDLIKNTVPSVPFAGFVPSPGLNGFIPSPGLNGMVQGEDGTWYQMSDDGGMGAYTASMVAPDQNGPWLNNWINN